MAKTSVLASRMRSPTQWPPLPCPALSAVKMPTPAKAIIIPANFQAVSASSRITTAITSTITGPRATIRPVCATVLRAIPPIKVSWFRAMPFAAIATRKSHFRGDNCRRRIRPLARKQMAINYRRAQHAQLRQRQGAEPRQGFLAGNDVAGPADRHQQHQQVHAAVAGAGGGFRSRNRCGATQTTPSAPSTFRSAADWGCTPTPPSGERESCPARSP